MTDTQAQILDYLLQYNDHETFYRTYHEAHKDPQSLTAFLKEYEGKGNELYEKRLIVPEIEGSWNPVSMNDDVLADLHTMDDITVYKHNRYTPVFRHLHTFFEMIYVVQGTCINNIAGRQLNLHTGDVCLVAPFAEHSIQVFDDSLVLNILVTRSTFEKLFHSLLCQSNVLSDFFSGSLYLYQQNSYLYVQTEGDAAMKSLILDMAVQEFNDYPYRNLMMNSLLMLFFARLLQSHEQAIQLPETQRLDSQMVDMIKYIESSFRTITLSELADQFGYSTGYLSRYIKKSTGKSFTSLVQEIKFENVCTLLETSTRSVADIAAQAGFESIEHFTRLFKKRMNVSPSQYRKAHQ